MPNTNEQDPVVEPTLFSQIVVDALSGLVWLTNAQRLDIADALSPVFVAAPPNPDLLTVERGALENAVAAVSVVDKNYRRTGLDELSRERMALKRVLGELDDLMRKIDPNKRSAGVLGWRKKESTNAK